MLTQLIKTCSVCSRWHGIPAFLWLLTWYRVVRSNAHISSILYSNPHLVSCFKFLSVCLKTIFPFPAVLHTCVVFSDLRLTFVCFEIHSICNPEIEALVFVSLYVYNFFIFWCFGSVSQHVLLVATRVKLAYPLQSHV